MGPAIIVATFDIAKGAAAVAIASWLLDWPQMWLVGASQLFVLAAGLAAVAGHMWSIYLKFTGGNGLATSLGALSVLMTKELIIVIAITLLLAVITRNTVLLGEYQPSFGAGIGLVSGKIMAISYLLHCFDNNTDTPLPAHS